MSKPHGGGPGATANGPRPRPTLRDQAAAHRASKGSTTVRALALADKADARFARATAAKQALPPNATPWRETPAEYEAARTANGRLLRAIRTRNRAGAILRRSYRTPRP